MQRDPGSEHLGTETDENECIPVDVRVREDRYGWSNSVSARKLGCDIALSPERGRERSGDDSLRSLEHVDAASRKHEKM